MAGIIFFEDGSVEMFGQIATARKIIVAINKTVPELIKQEREQIFATITDDELKRIVDTRAKKVNMDDE